MLCSPLPAMVVLVLFIPWGVGAEESGRGKYCFGGRDALSPSASPDPNPQQLADGRVTIHYHPARREGRLIGQSVVCLF